MPELAAHLERVAKASACVDWYQVVLNGGPPCFHLYEQGFCLRARHWGGHANGVAKENRDGAAHEFVSFAEFLAAALAACAREANERAAQCAESQKLGTGPVGVAYAIRALERAVGEKAALDPQGGQHES